MNENNSSNISLARLLLCFRQGLAKFWWLVLVLAILGGSIMGLRAWLSYTPQYTATVTFTVNVKNTMQASISIYNSTTAEQLGKTFPYILTSGLLSDKVKADLGVNALPQISASAEEYTNIFKLSVTGSDPEECYRVLKSVVKNYPEVAEFVVGATEFTVVDDTGVPTKPVNQRSIARPAERGLLIGLVIGLALAFAYGYSKATIAGREDMKSISNVKYLGSLPDVSAKKRSNRDDMVLSVNTVNNRGYKEAFRLITNRVDKTMREKEYKCLMVSSAIPGEGKTTITFNLAQSLAKLGRRVLLIDCDMRNPSVLKMTDCKPCPGLSEYLSGKAKADRLINKDVAENLDVIFAGKRSDESAELLGTDTFKELVEKCRAEYEYVLLDTPPCTIMTDATEICYVSDAAILAIRQNFASKNSVTNALNCIEDADSEIMGYILNAFGSKSSGKYGYNYGYAYGYGYGRGYGYGYGYGEEDK